MENIQLSEHEKHLITLLRDEVKDVKECYTKFSFQALAITIAVFGVIFKFQADGEHYIVFTGIPTIIVLVMVARMGCFKYVTANRNLGYELHLYQTRFVANESVEGWQPYMREVGWEEAMRAWRVVQTTVYKKLYYYRGVFKAAVLKNKKLNSKPWFEPNSHTEPSAVYYPGSYLEIMNGLLVAIAFMLTIPMILATVELYNTISNNLYFWFGAFALLSIFGIIVYSLNLRRRRKVLEEGLLSIPSCAIMWQCVIISHFRAMRCMKINGNADYNKYLTYLAAEANSLSKHIGDVRAWIVKGPECRKATEQATGDVFAAGQA